MRGNWVAMFFTVSPAPSTSSWTSAKSLSLRNQPATSCGVTGRAMNTLSVARASVSQNVSPGASVPCGFHFTSTPICQLPGGMASAGTSNGTTSPVSRCSAGCWPMAAATR